jgi:hypothetical protein
MLAPRPDPPRFAATRRGRGGRIGGESNRKKPRKNKFAPHFFRKGLDFKSNFCAGRAAEIRGERGKRVGSNFFGSTLLTAQRWYGTIWSSSRIESSEGGSGIPGRFCVMGRLSGAVANARAGG